MNNRSIRTKPCDGGKTVPHVQILFAENKIILDIEKGGEIKQPLIS